MTTTPEAWTDPANADLIAFLNARLDEDWVRAEKRLCINCGGRTAPLRNAFGITGYTHDSWNPETEARDGWEGQRCPNRLTGAEPIQGRARALREVEAKRRMLELAWDADQGDRILDEEIAREPKPGEVTTGGLILRAMAAVYSDHPDYRPEWKPADLPGAGSA